MKNLILLFLLAFSGSLFAQHNLDGFFDRTEAFLKQHVHSGNVNYAAAKSDAQLDALLTEIATTDLGSADANTVQAFYINAYNLLIIAQAAEAYPLQSVLNVNGFFDQKKYKVAGRTLTLNQLEKDVLLKTYGDARFHFVLVCGAVGCPPITDFAYRPAQLEAQLERQTRLALNDDQFIRVDVTQRRVQLSQIFEWYARDFGGKTTAAIEFINRYRQEAIPDDYSVSFYTYDWSLNTSTSTTGEVGNNAARYVVSSTIPQGSTETKIFNNLYTQTTPTDGADERTRSTFFTTNVQFLYGLNPRLNVGFDLKYRRVSNGLAADSRFAVLDSDPSGFRQGVTGLGPKIRYAPFAQLENFSIQSTFWLPVGSDLEGTADQPFIDWNGAIWFTQVFNDFPIGNNFSVFTEVDLTWEDIGATDTGHLNRFSTPVTGIFSYFPNPKTTLYALGSYAPFWQSDFDYFAQAGVGAKYQVTPNFELEVLYTAFTNGFLRSVEGEASTVNFGIRFNI